MKRILAFLLLCGLPFIVTAQQSYDLKIEKPEKYGATPNTYTAEFRLWLPDSNETLNYILVLAPGFNGDGRGMANDHAWQSLAKEYHCAILACKFTVNGSAPNYSIAENWSGKALLDTIKQFSVISQKPELDNIPLLLWGHSAGGGYSYNVANWKSNRVAAFVLVKSALNTAEPQSGILKIPGLFIAGENDKERISLISDRYNSGRKRGALWCYAFEPNSGHEVGQSAVLGRAFLKSVITYRNSQSGAGSDISWLGELDDHSIHAKGESSASNKASCWLPDEVFAKIWQLFARGEKISE